MPQQWYYRRGRDGETHGPISRGQLQQLIRAGELDGQSQVIRDGMSQWVPVSSIDATDDDASPPPVKDSGHESAPPETPARPAPSAYRRPISRPPRRQNHLPLYFGSLAAVAILAALLGWMANSLSSSNQEKESSQAKLAGANSDTSNESKQRNSTPLAKQSAGDSAERPRREGDFAASVETRSEGAPKPSPNSVAFNDADNSSNSRSYGSAGTRLSAAADKSRSEAEAIAAPRRQDATTPQATSKPVADEKPAGKQSATTQEPAVLFQELDIQRQPKLSMLGSVMAQDIHYRILSELHVQQPDEEGFRDVQQVVKDTQLVKADALSRTMFEASLKRLIGWQFSYTLNFRNEVVEIRGPDDGKKVAPVAPPGAKGFLVSSVMDEDGWKELAELTFFTPDPKGMQNQSWTRQMTHDYEPLGSWYGETTFVPRGKEQDLLRVDYAHKLTYKPPAKGAAAAGGLPFTINNADFKAGTAGGIIYFDTRLDRVQSAQEQFHVRGTLTADALGQVLNIPVEEKQAITVRVADQNTWEKNPSE